MKHHTKIVGMARILVALGVSCAAGADTENTPPAQPLTLWYQQPAADAKPMNQALPIGNGRLGALIFGSPQRERLSFNEDAAISIQITIVHRRTSLASCATVRTPFGA
ncbi:MAG: glycoside hydrolase family 95 protein [Akkermansiaceae bacterium]|nr:glycoside hydrolase family 95 protein [Akkermansiaceae bacterium]